MNFFIEIDEDNIVVHESECKEISSDLLKTYIYDFYETYEETLDEAYKKEKIYDLECKVCNCCIRHIVDSAIKEERV